MTHAYTPGLKLARRMWHRVCRRLPIPGEVVVQVGQKVQARQVVARTWLPGQVTPINVAHRLGISATEVPGVVQVQKGQAVRTGDLLAQTRGFFGLFRSELRAPSDGTIESISATTGQVILRGPPQPLELLAYLAGEVTEVLPGEGVWIEAEVALVQGIFGVGGEAYGPIRLACSGPSDPLLPEALEESMHGAVVIGGARVSAQALVRARSLGISAIVAGGMDDEDLRHFLGYDLGVAITGSESLGLTLILTEGFGEIAVQERTWELLASHEGDEAAVNGATQIRAGVIRPEVVIPLKTTDRPTLPEEVSAGNGSAGFQATLQVGSRVRIIRAPYFGRVGRIVALPPEPQTLPSGVKARVVEVELSPGERVIVPRANVEWIEEE